MRRTPRTVADTRRWRHSAATQHGRRDRGRRRRRPPSWRDPAGRRLGRGGRQPNPDRCRPTSRTASRPGGPLVRRIGRLRASAPAPGRRHRRAAARRRARGGTRAGRQMAGWMDGPSAVISLASAALDDAVDPEIRARILLRMANEADHIGSRPALTHVDAAITVLREPPTDGTVRDPTCSPAPCCKPRRSATRRGSATIRPPSRKPRRSWARCHGARPMATSARRAAPISCAGSGPPTTTCFRGARWCDGRPRPQSERGIDARSLSTNRRWRSSRCGSETWPERGRTPRQRWTPRPSPSTRRHAVRPSPRSPVPHSCAATSTRPSRRPGMA